MRLEELRQRVCLLIVTNGTRKLHVPDVVGTAFGKGNDVITCGLFLVIAHEIDRIATQSTIASVFANELTELPASYLELFSTLLSVRVFLLP